MTWSVSAFTFISWNLVYTLFMFLAYSMGCYILVLLHMLVPLAGIPSFYLATYNSFLRLSPHVIFSWLTSCLEKAPSVLPQFHGASRPKGECLLHIAFFRLNSRAGAETFLSTSMTPCVYLVHSRGSENAVDGQKDWWIDRWMDGYHTTRSFSSLLQATYFYQNQRLQW